MPSRHFPVRPDLDQLKHQAKDLLRAFRRSDPQAIEDFREYAPQAIEPSKPRSSQTRNLFLPAATAFRTGRAWWLPAA